MSATFVFPKTLISLEQEDFDQNSGHLSVQNPTSISSLRPSDLEEFVKGVSFDLSDKELFCVEEQDVFDRIYSLIKGFNDLTPGCKFNIVESLRSNFSVLVPNIDSLFRVPNSPVNNGCEDDNGDGMLDRVNSHRNAFKIYTFFLIHVVISQESNSVSSNTTKVLPSGRKKHPASSWNWEAQRGRILNAIANSLEINLSLLFGSSDPDENYLSFVVRNSLSMFESATVLKDAEAKEALCRVIGTCATKYHFLAQSCASILHLLHKHDFAVIHLADAAAWAEKKYADGSLAISLVREIGRTNPKDYVKDTVGAENIGRFLVEIADRLPKLISTNIGLLVPHFGGESYKIRNALVGVLGKLVAKAFNDIEGEVSSKSIRLRAKQAMLEILLERARDVSAYTRSRVLQVWVELCEEHCLSIGLWNEVAVVAAGRLEDKSAIVRKYALNLLIMMLQHNPFGPQLRVSSFEATLKQYTKKLNELEPRASSESVLDRDTGNEDDDDDGLVEDKDEVSKEQIDSLSDSCVPNEDEQSTQIDSSVPDVGNLEQTRSLIASLEAGLRFSQSISDTMPTLVQLMASSSASDVENTILLLMRCKQFQIDGSEACLRKMLPLVFSQDKSIFEAVENAFVTIYITKSPIETAKNLITLATDSNIGDLAALEFIVGALVSKGDISASAISALWDYFCFNVNGTSAERSRGALSILCMAAKSSSDVLSSHLQDIIDIGFGRWAKVEPLLARTACIALQRLSPDDQKTLLTNHGTRVFGVLDSLITGTWLPEHIWYAAADKAISTIYAIHPSPETLAANLVKKSHNSVIGVELLNDADGGGSNVITTVQVTKLSRFLYVISHVAMNQLVYIESCVRKIQKEKAKKEKMAAEGHNAGDNGGKPPTEPKDDINAELGVAASEDALLDILSERAEKEIVSGASTEKNLIGHCSSFLSKLCRNFSLMQKYPELQASGMLALCKLMIIDANFCEANLQILFTVVESAPSETVRSNCTIALGDLAVRFPNLLEPWTENMYSRLHDPSVSVRKNAVLVLSHLILNDMMKVKGHINEMAMRLEDEDERISNLAKLFFNELSKKGNNPIYNLLPDILGKLSNQDLKRESFFNIMQFLIGSIKKDKQMEALVEKLCYRFNGVTDARQWENISYCLSQLSFTDKGIKKLVELFKVYEHVLSNEDVMEHFRSIINKGKKFAKPELKTCIEEFEDKVSKYHIDKKEQELTARNAAIHQQKADAIKNMTLDANIEDESAESEDAEGLSDGEVMDPTMEENSVDPSNENESKPVDSEKSNVSSNENASEPVDNEECSHASSQVIQSEPCDDEVQSPLVIPKGTARHRAKKISNASEKADSNAGHVSSMRVTRSRRR
ncbi:condensin-1 complex subunit CAP-D2 [Rutidosis leptorrhynchoides]|uniref:condensin-1 complex subunit CAP-D2 n=1 Tax=Rutidosis leptorrhynchoides TaxID=125765 RepID=UPI003A996E78